MKEDFLQKKIEERKEAGAYRKLLLNSDKIDFCSNDYLGIVKNDLLETSFHDPGGSTGSRLLSGNYSFIEETEKKIAVFHESQSALIFNSGYDANIGLLSCVPQRGDTILYDYLCHASIRDGIRLSFASHVSFLHNDFEDLGKKLILAKGNKFVVTESVFSMDGDMTELSQLSSLCNQYDAQLIVDEAHATGVIGDNGEGCVQKAGVTNDVFARIHTYGKATGCHGASVLGSDMLRNYLVNFCRPFIYSTALPPSAVRAINKTYDVFPGMNEDRKHLQELIAVFQQAPLRYQKLDSQTPIQGVIIPGNMEVKNIASGLQESGFDIRPILYPTVPLGKERLRIVLHSFNSIDELNQVICILE